MSRNRLLSSAVILSLLLGGCRLYTVTNGDPDVKWNEITSILGALPTSIHVFEGVDRNYPLHAYYARIRIDDSIRSARFIVSDEQDGREPATRMARDENACVLINGGYFFVKKGVGGHIGLRVSGGRIVNRATPGIIVNDIRYKSTRAALGFSDTGKPSVHWASMEHDSLFSWKIPPPNKPGIPAPGLDRSLASVWSPQEALAAGPMLIKDSHLSVTPDEEVFFGTAIPKTHPRSAVGITEGGDLILLVVDGRQSDSRGVDLPQLANLLVTLGAVDAMNLDGGGSSELIVNGRLVNRPLGSLTEREIVSALAIGCNPDSLKIR